MLSNTKYSGIKPLNKVLQNYPNFYFTLHEGLAGVNPGVISEVGGSGLRCVPQTSTPAQWSTKPGWWSGVATNNADYLQINRADDPDFYDSVMNMENTVLVTMAHVYAAGDPSAACRLWSIANLNVPSGALMESQLEVKYLTSGQIQTHWQGSGGAVAQTGIDLPAAAAPNEAIIISVLNTITDEATNYAYFPKSKALMIAAVTSSIAGINLNTVIAPNQQVAIGAFPTAGTAYGSFLKNAAIKDFRAINFGSNPPLDMSEILEELAINTLAGSRR